VGWPRPLRRRGRDDLPARLSGAADATGLARHHPVIAGRVDERFFIPALTATTLVTNIVGHATDEVSDEVQLRVIAYWARVDAHLGAQVAAGLGDGNGGTGGHVAAQVAEVVGGTRETAPERLLEAPVGSQRSALGRRCPAVSGADVANPDVGRSRRVPPDVLPNVLRSTRRGRRGVYARGHQVVGGGARALRDKLAAWAKQTARTHRANQGVTTARGYARCSTAPLAGRSARWR
jgi:hypothetical protein